MEVKLDVLNHRFELWINGTTFLNKPRPEDPVRGLRDGELPPGCYVNGQRVEPDIFLAMVKVKLDAETRIAQATT
jgi:hypothetical protein